MALSEKERATAEAIVNGWLWQPAEGHNYRFRYATRTLTRFCEATSLQPDEMRLVIEFLRTQEVTGGVSLLNRSVDFGTGWKAKDAWYQTMPGERWGNTESTKVRVYQVLVLPSADAKDGDGPYLVEDGCQYRVKHTFYWDVESLPEVPASSSGVASALQGVTRDRETGLFSCVVETRTRVQQDVAEYATSETAFAKTTEEQHLGVTADRVAATGKAAGVADGKLTRRRVTKNADCTSDVSNETVAEKAVSGAVVEYRKTLRGTVTRTVDRGQAAPLGGTGLAVGETRRSEQTEAGRWTNEKAVTAAEAAGTIGEGCTRSALTHTDTKTENVQEKPEVEQDAPAANKERRVEARRTEDGTWDVVTTDVAHEPKKVGPLEGGSPVVKTATTVGVNQPEIPQGGAGDVNVVRRVSATPNDHGSFSTSEETTTYVPQKRTAMGGTTVQTETVEVGVNQTEVPAAGTAAVNRRVDVSVSPNDHGSMSTQKRTTVYNPQKRTATGGTTVQAETVEVGVNQTEVPTAGTAAVNQRVDVSVSPNDHGSMSTQKRTTVYSESTVVSTTKWATETVTRTTKANDVNLAPTATMGEASGSPNDHGSASTTVAEYEPTAVDSDWITWDSTTVTASGTYKYHHGLRVFCNLEAPPTPPGGSNCSLNVRINKFGLFDGSLSYSDLYEWTQSGGSGSSGGSATGTARFTQFRVSPKGVPQRRVVTLPTVSYHGRGNEGSESDAAANSYLVAGLKLPERTYGTGAPTFGAWTDDK